MKLKPPRPSGAYQWSVCFGSHRMQARMQAIDTSEAAEEGTAIHWIGETILLTYVNATPMLKRSDFVGKMSPNEILITDDMYDCADEYVMDILKTVSKGLTIQDLQVEQPVDLDIIYPGMKGTPDCWSYNSTTKKLTIWDLKSGRGYVDAVKNPQMMIYAAGIIEQLDIIGDVNIDIKIVQPRVNHALGTVRTWQITSLHLHPLTADLSKAAHIAMSDMPTCKAGTHCRYCTARQACDSLAQTVYNCVDVVTGSATSPLQAKALSKELKLLRYMSKLLSYRLTAIESEVEHKLNNGEIIPDFKAETKFGRKRWKKDVDLKQVATMGDLCGVDLRKPLELLTPTQAASKGVGKEAIALFSETPRAGITIVEDDTTTAQEAFKK